MLVTSFLEGTPDTTSVICSAAVLMTCRSSYANCGRRVLGPCRLSVGTSSFGHAGLQFLLGGGSECRDTNFISWHPCWKSKILILCIRGCHLIGLTLRRFFREFLSLRRPSAIRAFGAQPRK